MYLNQQSTVERGSDVVPFTAVNLEHRDELVILMIAPRYSSDLRVEGLSPLLRQVD